MNWATQAPPVYNFKRQIVRPTEGKLDNSAEEIKSRSKQMGREKLLPTRMAQYYKVDH